jgi:hypothetical protein
MKDQLKKNLDELVTMGKGAINLGQEKLNDFQNSEEFKKFDNSVKDSVNKLEEEGKKLKEELIARGSKQENK